MQASSGNYFHFSSEIAFEPRYYVASISALGKNLWGDGGPEARQPNANLLQPRALTRIDPIFLIGKIMQKTIEKRATHMFPDVHTSRSSVAKMSM